MIQFKPTGADDYFMKKGHVKLELAQTYSPRENRKTF